jgi:acetyl/propionyl-CoA carboxylase alpha subunit/acetyl-CoA carboxylase carboxyltransferase component
VQRRPRRLKLSTSPKSSRRGSINKLLIANRGEIAIRIARAAADLGIPAVAVFSEDDDSSLHALRADDARALRGKGAAAYMDVDQLLEVAGASACDAIHPGYGFLSESAEFARRCAEAELVFVGPRPEVLELLGDKAQARALARGLKVPVLAGFNGAATLEQTRDFLETLPEGSKIAIKALFGGGGRGMRIVSSSDQLDEAYERCRSEARAAFGRDEVYVEQFLPRARHVEVQVLGDGSTVSHLGERECTIQRRHQKLIEIAPSPTSSPSLREHLANAAVRMAAELRHDNLGTFEFLVDAAAESDQPPFYFIEANPRLQVEHTVTEEVTGVDLVATQLQLAGGKSLAELGLSQTPFDASAGYAIQLRVNAEELAADGSVRMAGGRLTAFDPPTGPGVRVDTAACAGYAPNPAFDSLLAKVIVRSQSPDFAVAANRADRVLGDFRIAGTATNIGALRSVLRHPDFAAGRVHTTFLEEHAAELVPHEAEERQPAGLAGARIDSVDPLAVLEHGKSGATATAHSDYTMDAPEGAVVVNAPMQGTVISIEVAAGDTVSQGQSLLVMEAMKMEHVIAAPCLGRVSQVAVGVGDTVYEGHLLLLIEEEAGQEQSERLVEQEADLDHIRPDLAEVHARHRVGLDEARPDAVERRRQTGQRTARENINDLCDPGSFVEYGPLVIAAQRRRRPVDELIERTPADGLVAGVGTVNGDLFDESRSRVIAMSYDYTVLAGTQGQQNHRKKDRMFELAEKWRLPIVFFTEGGGGRPGDTDGVGVAGLDCLAFNYFGRLSGYVPLVGIVSGRCFAGNAALLGCCDVIIATRNANIGMGGPAMIEGGGLGIFRPEEVGPTDVQAPNGVVDVLVEDEAEATKVARQYLSYFQGPLKDWVAADQRLLRGIIPENRRRIYDVRQVIQTLADEGSVLELRRDFGLGMVTALARIEGNPVGIIANNPAHLAGAIDSNGADKAARFMQLCDAFDLPIVSLCDTPGIMVGPEVEKTALVRHASRMFVTGASLSVPFFTIILRKAYGLGAQAMAGGSFRAPFLTVSWPTGEFGGMGLEGAVKLGYRNDLAAIEDPAERKAQFDEMVQRMYDHGKAVNTASHFEIDDVIDPVDTRRWITAGLRSLPPQTTSEGKKRGFVDTW